jgi:menaquinone-dependent protoporphyrinogen oxidase
MAKHVLIATASKHGSTLEIADEIARVLARHSIDVTDKAVEEVDSLAEYDGVVIGSAVYVGHWMADAVEFVDRHAAELAERPVWLFSSGPIGNPAMPVGDPDGVAEMITRTRARSHRVFAGRLDPGRLAIGEKVIVRVLRAPTGDFRDWPEITAWAAEIAEQLYTAGKREALLVAAAH